MKLLVTYSTRPEYIKILPLLKQRQLGNIEFDTLRVGQHTNIITFPKTDHYIEIEDIGIDRLNCLTSQIALKAPNILKRYTHVLVQGDTSSVSNLALVAWQCGVKVIHAESGIRTFDKTQPFPEEGNRVSVGNYADIHFCPTLSAVQNLARQGITQGVYLTGNTVIDNLRDLETKYTNHVICTIHRRENVPIIDEIFDLLERLALSNGDLEFILPVHPNPKIVESAKRFKYVKVCNPLEYEDFLSILKDCRFVISDSGGIIEELSGLNKRGIILRDKTERMEAVESGHCVLANLKNLPEKFYEVKNNYIINKPSPFGDGYAAEKIVEILKNV